MSIEIQLIPIIDKSLYEKDNAFIVENREDCKVIIFKDEEILWFYNDNLDKVFVCKKIKEELIFEFLAYMFDKYNSFSGFDGALTDAGYKLLHFLPTMDINTPENEEKYFEILNSIVIELFGDEMLKFNYKLSENSKQKLRNICNENHEKFIAYCKEYNIS